MKKYLVKANALIANRSYETRMFLLAAVIGALSYFTLASNKIISSNTTPPYLKQSEIISCAPNSFYNEPFDPSLEEVQINDNRKPAGELRNGVYYINLEIREGNWYPESKEGRPIKIKALAEAGKPLQVPGPLIRVPEGTEIRATITNKIKDLPQELYGFYKRPVAFGKAYDSIRIEPAETKQVFFNAGAAGTYLYAVRDTVGKSAVPGPRVQNQSYGALIVDSKNETPDPSERIIIIGGCAVNGDSNLVALNFVLNGLSWPYTERLQYQQGKAVKWRLINASFAPHPLHLHGFPFTIKSLGNITDDSIVARKDERLAVTQLLQRLQTMRITWIPERQGNWLFHCHLLSHILPLTHLRNQEAMEHASMDIKTHAVNGMGGLIMGINVLPDKRFAAAQRKNNVAERKLSLVIGEKENYFDNSPGKGFQLFENDKATAHDFSIPGPPLIFYKDQPVAIKIINTLKEPTTIHWHGLEIESYYDGVAGWGNAGTSLAPLIQPGDSFTVHITPPRAGTYIYHTHMHDLQLLQGLYGAVIVLNRGEKFDPVTNKIFVIGQGGRDLSIPKAFSPGLAQAFGKPRQLLNGTDKPAVMHLKKGTTYRLRFINIKAQNFADFISMKTNDQLANWIMIAKDGMSLRKDQKKMAPAIQRIAIGESYDFEFRPQTAGDYFLHIDFPDATQQERKIVQTLKVEE